jgi:hypothetical protein
VSICHTGAIHQRSISSDDCETIDIQFVPKWDKVNQYLISRRLIRTIIHKPVEKEKLEQLLEVARFAQTVETAR